jgi:hypothetical protein
MDRAAAFARQLDDAAAQARSSGRNAGLAEMRAIAAERAARASEIRAVAAEARADAMQRGLAWRLAAPFRIRRRFDGGTVVPAAPAQPPAGGMARRAVMLAKRSGAYAALAPWIRERFPGAWSRAKRALMQNAVSEPPAPRLAGPDAARAPLRTYVPHDCSDPELNALAATASISVAQLQALLERALRRRLAP